MWGRTPSDHQTENLYSRNRSVAPLAHLQIMPQRTNKHKSTYIDRRAEVTDVCARSWCLSHQRKMKGIQWTWRAARCILPIAFSHQVTCSLPLDTLKIRRECLESRGSHLYAYVMVNKRTQTDGMVFTAESGFTVFRENNAAVLQVCPSL